MSRTVTVTERADIIRNWPPAGLVCWKDRLTTKDYGTMYSVYADLVLANSWTDVQLHLLASGLCPLVSGRKAGDTEKVHYVYPTLASHATSIRELSYLFSSMHEALGTKVDKILLGIVHTDSTVVYYTLNNGMTKPTIN